jgi:hypothetical protein
MAWKGRTGRAEVYGTKILNNEIYDIKRLGHNISGVNYENSRHLAVMGRETEIYNNLLIKGDQAWQFAKNLSLCDFKNNLILDIPGLYEGKPTDVTADYNHYCNSPKRLKLPGTNDTVSSSSNVPGHTDKVVLRKRITNPESVVIPHGQIGRESPLLATPTDVIDARPGIGVDDELVPVPQPSNRR